MVQGRTPIQRATSDCDTGSLIGAGLTLQGLQEHPGQVGPVLRLESQAAAAQIFR